MNIPASSFLPTPNLNIPFTPNDSRHFLPMWVWNASNCCICLLSISNNIRNNAQYLLNILACCKIPYIHYLCMRWILLTSFYRKKKAEARRMQFTLRYIASKRQIRDLSPGLGLSVQALPASHPLPLFSLFFHPSRSLPSLFFPFFLFNSFIHTSLTYNKPNLECTTLSTVMCI